MEFGEFWKSQLANILFCDLRVLARGPKITRPTNGT